MQFNELEKLVLSWASDRGILENGTKDAQIEKTLEEVLETKAAIEKYGMTHRHTTEQLSALEQIIDGIGDTVVTLIILSELTGTSLENCLKHAYNEIKDRTGKMENGTFVKDKKGD
jgi:NTP pyrophosphatase (non-canonical NTP hydrolase)